MKFHEVSKLCSSDQVCNQQMKSYPTYVHVISATALVAMAGNEICGLIATYMGSKNLWPKSLENFDDLTFKTWIASCRKKCPADWYLKCQKWLGWCSYFFRKERNLGFSERFFSTFRPNEADASPDSTFAEPLFTQLPAGGDVQLAGSGGVLLRPSGCQFGPRPFQCRRTNCDGAAV